jgi:hypothetical protein
MENLKNELHESQKDAAAWEKYAKQREKDLRAVIGTNADLLAALEQCLPILDAYRRISGGDGDISAMNARAAIAKARGQS